MLLPADFRHQAADKTRSLRAFWPCFTGTPFAIRARMGRQSTSTAAPSADPPAKGRTCEGTPFLRLQREKPHPTIARGAGPLHDLVSPTPYEDDRRGEVVITGTSILADPKAKPHPTIARGGQAGDPGADWHRPVRRSPCPERKEAAIEEVLDRK